MTGLNLIGSAAHPSVRRPGLNPAQCNIQSAKMAVALGVALAGGPAATNLLGSLKHVWDLVALL
jgi:hypothetical protein